MTSLLWAGHWLLRLWLAGYLLIYGWSKVFHMQMGYADFADALVQYGEMSPMGLLWRFMAFSPLSTCRSSSCSTSRSTCP